MLRVVRTDLMCSTIKAVERYKWDDLAREPLVDVTSRTNTWHILFREAYVGPATVSARQGRQSSRSQWLITSSRREGSKAPASLKRRPPSPRPPPRPGREGSKAPASLKRPQHGQASSGFDSREGSKAPASLKLCLRVGLQRRRVGREGSKAPASLKLACRDPKRGLVSRCVRGIGTCLRVGSPPVANHPRTQPDPPRHGVPLQPQPPQCGHKPRSVSRRRGRQPRTHPRPLPHASADAARERSRAARGSSH